MISVPSPKSLGFRCVQNGSSARREEGAYLDRYVTDEQRSSRPIFNATLRAAASWLFFRVARSTVMIQIAALRSRLEKQPTDLRRNPRDLGDGALVHCLVNRFKKWQPPRLCEFCGELLGRRHAKHSVSAPSYVVQGNDLLCQPIRRPSRNCLAGWLVG